MPEPAAYSKGRARRHRTARAGPPASDCYNPAPFFAALSAPDPRRLPSHARAASLP